MVELYSIAIDVCWLAFFLPFARRARVYSHKDLQDPGGGYRHTVRHSLLTPLRTALVGLRRASIHATNSHPI